MRKGELILNYAVMLFPAIFSIALVLAMNVAGLESVATFWGTIALFLFGFLLFAKAKLSVIKQGQFFSFGSSQMSKPNRISYFMGYVAMSLGFILFVGLALVAHFSP